MGLQAKSDKSLGVAGGPQLCDWMQMVARWLTFFFSFEKNQRMKESQQFW